MEERAMETWSRDGEIELSNNRLVQRAARLHLDRIPVLCECGAPKCAATFFVTPAEYAEARAAGTPLRAH
jgi:hypothetical protein